MEKQMKCHMKKCSLTAPIESERIRSSQMLLIKHTLINWSSVSVTTSLKEEIQGLCWSGAFRSGYHIYPGVDVPANSPQDLRLLLPISLGKVIRPFPDKMKPIIPLAFHKWKAFKTVANFPRSGRPSKFAPGSSCAVLRETAKTPQRATSQNWQVTMLNVKVHDSTIWKEPNKYSLPERVLLYL